MAYFLSKNREAVFLAYPKDGNDKGVSLPVVEDSADRLVAKVNVSPENKTAELAIYPDQIGGLLKLKFEFNESQDFLCAVVRVRPLSDVEETERPLVDFSIMYDPDENEAETVYISLPKEPVVIFIMFPEQLNLSYGSGTMTITAID